MRERPLATVDLNNEAMPAVLVMRGEFDLHAQQGLREPISRLLADPPADLLVDMSEVAFIDSSGIAMLVDIYSQVVRQPDGQMRIQGISPAARRLFEICGLLETFGIADWSADGQRAPE